MKGPVTRLTIIKLLLFIFTLFLSFPAFDNDPKINLFNKYFDEFYDLSNKIPKNPDAVESRSKENIQSPSAPFIVDPSNFSFIVVADTHYRKHSLGLQNVYDQNPGINFIMIAGDIADVGASSQYDVYEIDTMSIPVPVYPLLGNHDIFEGWNQYKERYGKNYYHFEIGNTLILALDDASGCLGKTQTDWLINMLSSTPCTNRIIISHFVLYKPPYAYDSEITDIVQKYNVQLSIFGHEHRFRSFKIGNNPEEYIVLNRFSRMENSGIQVTVKDGVMTWKVISLSL
jgi:predicted phosphodiesterase